MANERENSSSEHQRQLLLAALRDEFSRTDDNIFDVIRRTQRIFSVFLGGADVAKGIRLSEVLLAKSSSGLESREERQRLRLTKGVVEAMNDSLLTVMKRHRGSYRHPQDIIRDAMADWSSLHPNDPISNPKWVDRFAAVRKAEPCIRSIKEGRSNNTTLWSWLDPAER
jgi:hypothetical protein